ncbi:NAD-dependent epimerase/dehydratase family protein [Vibrio sp. JPW-9-11-11]|uniref:NAD-dependent epimerase/dehydratase family protein n=1 Tax=Vibrio sp. JPW-9-11-11 TaxID=1416532 RepID=UPI001593FFF4|nr:NAD-dependent epimerase/dehydratase family protein [Vibrio sp. JPW-9-11-11]
MKTITVIGGGWLGKPLSQYLLSIGYQVFTSKTTHQGADELNQQGLHGFVCDLNQGSQPLLEHLTHHPSDIIIGCFPPGFRRGGGQNYVKYWRSLVEAAQKKDVKRVVMVSSTTVYPTLAKEMREEDASLSLAQSNAQFSDNAVTMLTAEQCLIDSGLEYAVVRCSGLVGPDRHPSRFAARLKQVSDQASANMIELKDAIGTVSYMALYKENCVVNATTPNTVSKAEFYQAALDSVGANDPLPPVVHQADKRILADKIVSLGYRFHYDHTLELV